MENAALRRLAALGAHITVVSAGDGDATTLVADAPNGVDGDGGDDDPVVIRYATAADLATLRKVTHYGFAGQDDPDEAAEEAAALGASDDWLMGAFNRDNQAVSQVVAHPWQLGGGGGGGSGT